MHIELQRDKSTDIWHGDRASWRLLKADDKTSALVTCAKCGRSCTLTQHTIADDGEVMPSLVCPYDNCDWHVFVKLVGWIPS